MTASPTVRKRGMEGTRTKTKAPKGASSGEWAAATGLLAVNAAEQLICGSGAVPTAAAAEGLALTGQRAARVFGSDAAGTAVGIAAAPWVLHRTSAERGAAPFGAFELVPATVQEAVDHCLAARVLVRRLDRAGECVMEPRLLSAPALFQPLSEELLESALGQGNGGSGDDAPSIASVFAELTKASGRVSGPLVLHRMEDAEHVLVAAGAARQWAAQLVYALRKEGVKLGLVGVTLLRPFPVDALAKALADKRSVVVVEGPFPELLAEVDAAMRSAHNGKEALELGLLDAWQGHALKALRDALSVSASGPDDLPEPAAPGVLMGVAPAGARAESLLLDVASAVAPLGQLELWRPQAGAARAALLGVSKAPARVEEVDVMFVAHPSLFDPNGVGQSIRKGGSLVIAAPVKSSGQLWQELGAAQRELIRQRELKLTWLSLDAENRDEARSPDASWRAIRGALLAVAAPVFEGRLGLGLEDVVGPIGELLEPVDTSVDVTGQQRGLDFEVGSDLPVMPAGADQAASDAWRTALRRFHVTGRGAAGTAALLPLAPASVSALVARDGIAPGYPLVVRDESVKSMGDVLGETLQALAERGKPAGVVSENLELLTSLVLGLAAERPGAQPLRPVLDAALAKFHNTFQLSEAADKSLGEELEGLSSALPNDGLLIGQSEYAHIELYARAVRAERGARVLAFVDEARQLTIGLRELLRMEATASPEAATADRVAKSLGGTEDLFDAASLVKSLPARRGPSRLGSERKKRIEQALDVLNEYLEQAVSEPDLFIVHPGLLPAELQLGKARLVRHPEGLSAAAGLFDGLAQRLANVLRAVRVARLEIDNEYDPTVFDQAFQEFDWTAFTSEELLLVPPVMVLETAERVWQVSLDALSELLRSGRPIHVVINESIAHHEGGTEATVSSPAGLGYLLVAHHEAVVVQSTLARPHHLADGFARMARALRPSVCVVESRPAVGPMPAWLRLSASHEGRALPCFRYDPELGTSFADNFDIEANPEPERIWPRHTVDYLDVDGNQHQLELSFTFADAAALDLAYREHFWLIPPEAWSDEQIPLDEFVELLGEAPPAKVPYVWVVDDAGKLGRAVVTRQLGYECRERMRLWRILQELGGSENEHARRAAEQSRQAALAEAEASKAELDAAHAEELERVRSEAAGEAMDRLAKMLLDPDALLSAVPLGASPQAAPAPRPAATSEAPTSSEALAPATDPSPPPTAEPDEAEEEGLSFDEPYIDTPLCTTCNECTNLNPKMFQYNADKQAFIADASAGTFAQLVTAAEKCPASCIHPGVPRKDDDTVTDELVQRAARFK